MKPRGCPSINRLVYWLRRFRCAKGAVRKVDHLVGIVCNALVEVVVVAVKCREQCALAQLNCVSPELNLNLGQKEQHNEKATSADTRQLS